MWRLVVAHCRCRGECSQDFVIHRMKLPGTHRRDPRWKLGERQRFEPHEQPCGSLADDHILRNQTSDDRGQPSSAVIERDDASGVRGLSRCDAPARWYSPCLATRCETKVCDECCGKRPWWLLLFLRHILQL